MPQNGDGILRIGARPLLLILNTQLRGYKSTAYRYLLATNSGKSKIRSLSGKLFTDPMVGKYFMKSN